MNGGRLALSLSILLALACAAPAAGERFTYVYGRVLDPSGASIPEASVTVVNQDNGFRRIALSQPDGEFAVGSLEPGLYKITVRKEGFGAMIRFNVKLEPAQPARADFLLSIGPVAETITVEGTAPLLNPEESSIGMRVYHDEIERLPLNGRGLLALLDLTPGANIVPATRGEAGQFTMNGQRPNTNYFTVDGVGANIGIAAGGLPAQVAGGALPAVSAFGSLDSLLPLEAIDEFRLQSADAAPEAARLPGAVATLTSRSGSNEFHGSLAYRFRHELAAANDWFANVSGEGRGLLRLQDVAPSVGGPIRRDRSFFFVSYEHMALRGPYVWQQAVPSLDLRAAAPAFLQPALDLFPAPNGRQLADGVAQWSGRNIRPSVLDSGMVRIDQALTPRLTLFGRYNDAPSSNQFGSTQVNRLDLRFRSLTLGLNARPTARVILDLRANESQAEVSSTWTEAGGTVPAGCVLQEVTARYRVPDAPCEHLVRLLISGIGQVAAGSEGERRQRQFQTIGSATINAGSHSLRLGIDYRRMTPVRRDAGSGLSLIADGVAEIADPRNLWIGRGKAVSSTIDVREISAWLQDTWRLGSWVTLTPSLRWQLDPPPFPSGDSYFFNPATGTVQSFRRPLWPRTRGDLAPRLGVAFRLDRQGRTVVRGGAGLSYESSMSIGTDFINSGPLGVTEFTSAVHAPFSTQLSYGFMPGLRAPRILSWGVSLDHAFGSHDLASIGYVSSTGWSLIRRELGGPGNSTTALVALTTNHGHSDYRGLQMEYRRRLAGGFDALASYAWAHSIDDDSSDAFLMWAGSGTTVRGDRGSSDFDLRHAFSAALSYEFPSRAPGILRALGGWAIDAMVRARTGFPMTVLESDQYLGVSLENAFRPDLAWGEPMWIRDDGAPGGRRLNTNAFLDPGPGIQGRLGRNAITGFGMSQADVAVRREFRLTDRRGFQLRIEAFNALNQANFADPVKFLSSPVFGRSPSMLNLMLGTGSPGSGLAPLLQTGGARSLQASMRFRF